ncbi:HAD family hydrolase [Syntrophobacter fumaroxidans]|uniref:HAD-superfamily hydrolase, subfamily IA, variant 3 n=1 Tax=Syntrophobacter fumaroxidans (strain DSM 10017 / MPOB) TaxID=335543 RepID=A0LNI6_SYNFM|nr:HAD family phosphatase [Syntrophobacter fumaroxidans]ABK18988.1 HAD-superfamily hydrolase, subfamily IA, variant 3 [Syntrophobacter fumaroxidans MPOB]
MQNVFDVGASFELQAVIFDCDGVLVDSEPLHYRALQEVLKPLGLGHDYARYLEHYIGFDDRDAFREAFREAGRDLDGRTLAELVDAKDGALRKIVADGVPTFPGVIELVRELHSHNVLLGVASGALRHEVSAFVASLGLQDCFSILVAADDVERSKPDPQTYIKALDEVRVLGGHAVLDARNCVAVEDTPAGIQSARTAGMYVVGITNSFPRGSLEDADHIVGSLSELDHAGLIRLVRTGRS